MYRLRLQRDQDARACRVVLLSGVVKEAVLSATHGQPVSTTERTDQSNDEQVAERSSDVMHLLVSVPSLHFRYANDGRYHRRGIRKHAWEYLLANVAEKGGCVI